MGKLVKNWSLILICLFAFLLRTWNIENLFYFTYDESIPAFVGRRMILWNHIPLIGAATPFGTQADTDLVHVSPPSSSLDHPS